MQQYSSEGAIPRRPSLFRALGSLDPPAEIEVNGHRCLRTDILKHDSWAATVRYVDADGFAVACKFNRVNPLVFVPMSSLGQFLARREKSILQLMDGVKGFPRSPGAVFVDGKEVQNAVAHGWIEGRTFTPWSRVDDEFFPLLHAMVGELHVRDIAYVDMSKWQNIAIGDDGSPYLIDYQIHVRLQHGSPFRWCLR